MEARSVMLKAATSRRDRRHVFARFVGGMMVGTITSKRDAYLSGDSIKLRLHALQYQLPEGRGHETALAVRYVPLSPK
jgi:hypothetical protein